MTNACLCVGQVISAVSSSGAKAGATVLAEDKTTGLVLRADVILDKIYSLKVRGGGGLAAPTRGAYQPKCGRPGGGEA